MFAELIGTKGKVVALARGRIGGGETAAATMGDQVTGGTGLAWEEGTASSDVVNMAKDHITRVLQVLKVVEIGLMGEDGCLGMDALEMTMRHGGSAVGLVVGMMQVPRTKVGINREPQKVMQNKHHSHQKEQVKKWNKIDQMILEPSKEH